MRRILATLALLGLTTFWACHLGPESSKDSFDIVGDTAWTHCDTLELLLLDDSGRVLDTLFRDTLEDIDDLKDLPAGKYRGGKARVQIKGYFRNGDICVDQTRSFEDGGAQVKVDTVKDPSALPVSVVADPAFLSLAADAAAGKIVGKVLPLYADQGILWSIDSSGVASLDVSPDTAVNEVQVRPLALGEAFITLRSRKDPSKTARVRVSVAAAAAVSVTLDQDSLLLYVNGPEDSLKAVVLPHLADPAVAWSSADQGIAQVDSAGHVTPGKEGRTVVRAVTGNGKRDSAVITVIPDVPKLVVASRDGAGVNVFLAFHAHATQKVGHIVSFAWDFHGDGAWDDSIPGPFHGDSVEFAPLEAKYASEGIFKARFRVRDSEGNIGLAERSVDIGNQAPEILDIRNDTVISIKDSIRMAATARDLDGKVAWVGWDYEGDGLFDDTLLTLDTLQVFARGHRYHDAGNYLAIFKAVDGNGKARQDTVKVKVELDEPVADMGNDTTVIVNTDILIRVMGKDGYGPIVSRELKVGDGPFVSLSSQDTVLKAPASPAVLTFIGRVTDDDGLTDVDTLKVTVILSANADLADLTVSAGELVPAFRASTGNYAVQAAFRDSLVRVTPTARDPAAIILVNAKPVASGSPSEAVRLQVGSNHDIFQILVTAPDGSQRIYSVSVARHPNAEATLRSLEGTGFTLKPAFGANILEYADTVPAATAGITLRPTVASIGATVAIEGEPIASGTPSGPLPLAFGDNAFDVVVTAMDGASRTNYRVRVVRRTKLIILRKLGSAAAVPADSAELPLGTAVPLSSPGATGFAFSRWSLLEGSAFIADSAANPTQLTMGAGLVRVQAAFTQNRWSITGTATGCGALNPPGQVTVDQGTPVHYTLTPLEGCRIASVRIDGVEDTSAHDGTYSFGPVTAHHSLAATFVRTFALRSQAGPGGIIRPDSVRLDSGRTQEFVITPDAGRRLLGVRLDGRVDSLALRRTLVADGNHLLEATFIAGYTLTATIVQGQGALTPTSVGVDSGQGATFDFSASASPPYRFLSLTDNGVDAGLPSNATSYSLASIDRPHTLQLRFLRRYAITVTASGPGSVSGAAGLADSGSNNSFTLQPGPGAVIRSLRVDGVETPPPANGIIAFNALNADHGIAVTFTRRFTVATTWNTSGASGGAGGSISPINPAVDSGASQVLAVTANGGYRLRSLLVNGGSVNPAASYTFASVNSAQTLHADFTRVFTMTGAIASGSGTITPASVTADSGTTVRFAFRPSADHRFVGLTDNGRSARPTEGDTAYSVAADAAHDVRVGYLRTYSLLVSAGPGGSVNQGSRRVDAGETLAFVATPSAGYRVDTVLVDGVMVPTTGLGRWSPQGWSVGPFSADHAVRVTFKRYYTLDVKAGGGGSLDPQSVDVDSGAAAEFRVGLVTGFHVSSLTLGNTDLMPFLIGNLLTLPSVRESGTLVALFSDLYTINLRSNVRPIGENTVPPRVCIVNESTQETACSSIRAPSTGAASMTVAYGSRMSIAAASEYQDCGGIRCEAYRFQYWTSPAFREPEPRNPFGFAATRHIDFTADYVSGDIRVVPQSAGP